MSRPPWEDKDCRPRLLSGHPGLRGDPAGQGDITGGAVAGVKVQGPGADGQVIARQGPSADAWFGTDTIGNDVFARVIYGARPVLILAPIAASIGVDPIHFAVIFLVGDAPPHSRFLSDCLRTAADFPTTACST